MKRLFGLGLVALIAGCASEAGPAQTSDDAVTIAHGDGVFESGVRTSRLQFTASPDAFGRQRSSNWCWAADLQTVLRFHGLAVTQEQIVQRAFGGLIDLPVSPVEIAATVDGWTFSDGARIAVVAAQTGPLDGLRIRSELEADRPGILALRNPGGGGHAYVLTSITYRLVPTPAGTMFVPLSVKLRDPWPENPNFLVLPWQEVQARFLGVVYISVLS